MSYYFHIFLISLYQIRVIRTLSASPEVTGTFDINFGDESQVETGYSIPRNSTADEMKIYLQSLDGIDAVKVTRSGYCAGCVYVFEFMVKDY